MSLMKKQVTAHVGFAPYSTRVSDCVDAFDCYVHENWPGNNRILQQRRGRWVAPGGPTPYYLPFWLDEVFGPIGARKLKTVAVANVLFYHYYTLKDDAIDKAYRLSSGDLLIADAMLGEGLRLLARAGASSIEFFDDLSRFMVEAIRAESSLANANRFADSFSPERFTQMGQKAALAKVCASALASIAGARSKFVSVSNALDDMAIGLQLLDDLNDWADDLRLGRFTYPLWLASRETPAKTHRVIGARIPTADVAGKVLLEMERFSQQAAEHFQDMGATNITRFLHSLISGSAEVRQMVASNKYSWPQLQRELRTRCQSGT